ncbi:Rpp14/Pop5 family protein [Metallosphaera hakonensis]|uniref:Rpp14/Pop5 family protein n=1 Tax=Metallosphaera hakonensis TaxID=79601 RepID=UPI003B838466
MYQTILDVIFGVWLIVLSFLILTRKSKNNLELRGHKPIKNKKRYVVFRVISASSSLSSKNLEDSIRSAVKDLSGRIWLEISDPHVIFYNPENMSGIVSTNRIGYRTVIASLPFVKTIEGAEVLIVPYRTTGSLKKAKSLIRSR